MKGKTKDQPRKGGRFGPKDTPIKQIVSYSEDPASIEAVNHLAEDFFGGDKSAARRFLILYALQGLRRPVEGVFLPLVPGLNAPDDTTSAHGDGNTQVVNSSINANTADQAMAATQIGNANRNVNVKKNHDKPVRPSKRRK